MDIPNNTHGRCDMVKLETALGEITISGPAQDLLHNDDIKKAYLGI